VIDHGRRERTRREKQEPLLYQTPTTHRPEAEMQFETAEMDYPDDRLRLIFTCCHPAINPEAQIALTLRTLGGLTTPEIARAFLLPEPTLAQRLVRAKRKIAEARIPYEVPPREKIGERLQAVQSVMYLIFNEGYAATVGDGLIRRELCAEAIRLARTLCQLLPNEPENLGLLALMLLHDSRRDARTDKQGRLIVLEEQDRSLWDKKRIKEGRELVSQALGMRSLGPYQMSEGLQTGLKLVEQAGETGELRDYHLFHAARADLLRRLGRRAEAAAAYEEASRLATNGVEKKFLKRRLDEVLGRESTRTNTNP
jgi:RNA polymerase sigma-70 factor (ECF subfamily)